jgi:hypothetical protein
MRAKTGAVGIGFMVLSTLAASSANPKNAEARSGSNALSTSVAARSTGTAPSPTQAPQVSTLSVHTVSAEQAEVIKPPPADLRLENPKLRRMQKDEITPALSALAASIVRKHYAKPVGTTIEVELEGKRVIARIERHFHPEGGAAKPWGFHPGVSLFVAR